MAKSKDINIEIGTDGKLIMDLDGFEGKECEKIADELIKILGSDATEKKKAEWYKKQTVRINQRRK